MEKGISTLIYFPGPTMTWGGGGLALIDQHSEGFGLDKHKIPIGTLF